MINQLLQQVNEINKKYELLYQKTGKRFNIFEVANIHYKEVIMCRVFYELLNPKGSHYHGDVYLRLFLEYVLKVKMPEEEFKSIKVFREFNPGGSKRRIDLVIRSQNYFMPIEVKIFAEDQESQCYDYFQETKKYCMDDPKIYYLTLDGHRPSDESAKGLTRVNNSDDYKEVSRISFKDDIYNWLKRCLKEESTIEVHSIREILIQLLNVIERLTNQTEEGKREEMVELLSKTEDNMRNAVEIEKSLVECKKEMIKKVLGAIDEIIQEIKKEKPEISFDWKYLAESDGNMNLHDFRYNTYHKVNTFYNNKQSSWPGISYKLKDIDKNIELWLRVEIDHELFIGFCVSENQENHGNLIDERKAEELLNNTNIENNNWWIYRYYLLNNDKAKAPNFKYFNDEYFELFDQEKFESFIAATKMDILKVLEKFKY